MGSKRIILCILLPALLGSFFLGGCQVVEPEKRAYPLVVGIDWKDGEYSIYFSMAKLSQTTGQGKSGGEEQNGNGQGALLVKGGSREEIEKKYRRSQELYLDPGHVQAVIFGGGIFRDQERFIEVLKQMEAETSLGNSPYVFGSDDLELVLEKNGREIESLGDFLTGIYENRTEEETPLTLGLIYRKLHNQGTLPGLPFVSAVENQLIVE